MFITQSHYLGQKMFSDRINSFKGQKDDLRVWETEKQFKCLKI